MHLANLDRMILGQHDAVASGEIKAGDIPTEYIVLFSVVLIASAGAFVAFQVKKSGTALPLASNSKRFD